MTTPFVSRFTPSLMTEDTLEALFIQRDRLAEDVLAGIRSSATTEAKHYVLLVGPRGLGKTHCVAVIRNRVLRDPELSGRLCIAWLREEERGVTTLLDLLTRILAALAREASADCVAPDFSALYDLPRGEAEERAKAMLRDAIGERALLLIVENLDVVFAGLKDVGQRALRAFLQEWGRCTILATTTSLFNGVSLRTSPFYGFFQVHHLEELTVDEAVGLLTRIAELKGDTELAEFLATPIGRARVRTLHQLTGGNHRVYVVLSECLTRASLDELVTPFMRMVDDLTPYYQGRMELLSPQQQQIVQLLANYGGALPVKDIARRGFMSQQTAANQILDLKEKGYLVGITPKADKRETFYELREPLMRICFEVKEYRGGPIRLFVEFLRLWYPQEELGARLMHLTDGNDIERACLEAAVKLAEAQLEDPRVDACLKDYDAAMNQEDYEGMAHIAEELTATCPDDPDAWSLLGQVLARIGKPNEALLAAERCQKLGGSEVQVSRIRGRALLGLKRFDEAGAEFSRVLAAEPSNLPAKEGLYLSRHRRCPTFDLITLRDELERDSLGFAERRWVGFANAYGCWLGEREMTARLINQPTTCIPPLADVVQCCWDAIVARRFSEATCYGVQALQTRNVVTIIDMSRLLLLSLPLLASNTITTAMRQQWVNEWSALALEYKLPGSILDSVRAGLTYIDSRDERDLLSLPSEARDIVIGLIA